MIIMCIILLKQLLRSGSMAAFLQVSMMEQQTSKIHSKPELSLKTIFAKLKMAEYSGSNLSWHLHM